MKKKVYYKKDGKLQCTHVDGFTSTPSKILQEIGLKDLRKVVNSDINSPIMVIAK